MFAIFKNIYVLGAIGAGLITSVSFWLFRNRNSGGDDPDITSESTDTTETKETLPHSKDENTAVVENKGVDGKKADETPQTAEPAPAQPSAPAKPAPTPEQPREDSPKTTAEKGKQNDDGQINVVKVTVPKEGESTNIDIDEILKGGTTITPKGK